MARTDQKQLLTLIREFASEKSNGERRVVGLKKQIEELYRQLQVTNDELEKAKQFKDSTEQELKGYEVELSLNKTSVQTLETRISMIQDDIASIGLEVEALKKQERALRDEFISQMLELNAKIRLFHEKTACYFMKENGIGTAAGLDIVDMNVTEDASKNLDDELAEILGQTFEEEEECIAEQNLQKQIESELADYKKKLYLMELNSELEQTIASLGEELQKRCICPSCYSDNMEALAIILQGNEET
ncbi:hypothetical protein ACFE04_007812 [Oxalis oulophora]